jgi:acetylornithine/succinyldiaminopimelate/putrescine aminotransferase
MARDPVASAFEPGDHATTFGGGPLPAAAALAALQVIEDDGLVDNAAIVGGRLVQGLEALREKNELIAEIRARGMMIAVDLRQPKAIRIKEICADLGLLINTVGDQMLRLLPPMILSAEEADTGLGLLEKALAQVSTD